MLMKMMERVTDDFPYRDDTEDEIFIICCDSVEFAEYVTGFDDIIAPFKSRHISHDFRNLNFDAAFKRENESIVSLEHHSSLTERILRRNNSYLATLLEAFGQKVYHYLFYTGDLPVIEDFDIDDKNKYKPNLFKTQEKDGMERLNIIKNKIYNQKKGELDFENYFDLIWFPRFDSDLSMEDRIMEIIRLYADMNVHEDFRDKMEKCLKLWAGRYVKDRKKLYEAAWRLNMTPEIGAFEEKLFSSYLFNKLEQAEDKGIEIGRGEGIEIGRGEGIEIGQSKFISKLLQSMTPEEISEEFDVPLENVLKVQKSKI